MRMYRQILLLIIIAISLCIAQTTIAVLDFDARNISAGEVATLTDRFRDELIKTNQFIVIERDKMEEVLKEQGFQQSGCTSDECVVEVGQLIGVEQMVGGSIGKVGNVYSVSARMIDIESGTISKVTTYDHVGDIGGLLTSGMRLVVQGLVTDRPITQSDQSTRLGSLSITSNPSNADIWIDGFRTGKSTPAVINDLEPDLYAILLKYDGYLDYEETVTTKNYVTEYLDIDLVQLSNLSITSIPNRAKIIINGESKGLTPGVFLARAGTKNIILQKNGFNDFELNIVVEPGVDVTREIELVPWMGSLELTSLPAGAEVKIDGMLKGATPLTIDQLIVGSHILELKLTDYLVDIQPVEIEKDQTENIIIELTSITNAKHKIATLGKNKLYYFAGSAGAFALAAVMSGMAYNTYNEYHTARSNATELHKTIDQQFQLAKVFLAISVGSAIPAVKYHLDQTKLSDHLERSK